VGNVVDGVVEASVEHPVAVGAVEGVGAWPEGSDLGGDLLQLVKLARGAAQRGDARDGAPKPPNMTKKSLTSRGVNVATREPTCTISMRPSPAGRRIGSMTGCLLTPNSVPIEPDG
jgi:hypothetical protein